MACGFLPFFRFRRSLIFTKTVVVVTDGTFKKFLGYGDYSGWPGRGCLTDAQETGMIVCYSFGIGTLRTGDEWNG